MLQTQSPHLRNILTEVVRLTPKELLQLIGYLAEMAEQTISEPESPRYQWTDIEGVLDESLVGMDAQEWVNQMRAHDREIPR